MWREFFYFQRSDRRVLLVLALLFGVVVAVFLTLGGSRTTAEPLPEDTLQEAHTYYRYDPVTQRHYPIRRRNGTVYYTEGRRVERFPFDPNTADSVQLLRLGLAPWQVRNIYKYRAAGGVYHKKEDFARLYGLDVKTFRELEPYIEIGPDYQPAHTLYDNTRTREGSDTLSARPSKLQVGETVPINRADTTQLQRIPGIGSYWARRIVAYRQQLGGFYSTAQLKDLDGFPADALAFLDADDAPLTKLNVNTATLRELQRHPYINFHRAKAITDYRRLKGRIRHLSDLKMLRDFPTDVIERLEPYVEY